jgi:hypothetical protein
MGLHTWCYKSRELYDEQNSLYKKLERHESGEEFLDDLELLQVETRSAEIYELNETDYHDVFRTNKREFDGQYTYDVIYSKEECDKWLKDNSHLVSNLSKEYLEKFWNEYPDGAIDFG